MENDSVLSAVIFGISALLLGAFEAGAGAVARALREKRAFDSGARTEELKERAEFRDKRLSTVIDLPGGAGASLRIAGVVAGAVALAAVSAETVAGWGLRWELTLPVVALATAALAAVSVAARSLGARFSNRALTAACAAARLLSRPLWPALLVYGRLLPKWAGTGENRELDISADAFEFQEFLKPLDKLEAEMVRGVVELDKTPAKDIMTPSELMTAASADATLDELADMMITAGHSRIPIFSKGNRDDIIGVAHARDLLEILAGGGRAAESEAAAGLNLRAPMLVPEFKTLEDLLKEFQDNQTHLAIVVDEYGGVSGIVTIEDLIEEIVGEIYDEFDQPTLQVRLSMKDLKYEVDAMMPLDDFNREMVVKAGMAGNEFATIGGLTLHLLGRAPVEGDKVEYGGWTIDVDKVEGRRIVSLKARRRRERTV